MRFVKCWAVTVELIWSAILDNLRKLSKNDTFLKCFKPYKKALNVNNYLKIHWNPYFTPLMNIIHLLSQEYHPSTIPGVYRSHKASVSAMAKLLESPSVSHSRKVYASAVTNPTPSPSVSASATQENNMGKVNDPKCSGAELNYNISILLSIALIACILA